jgi:hypothetical protein
LVLSPTSPAFNLKTGCFFGFLAVCGSGKVSLCTGLADYAKMVVQLDGKKVSIFWLGVLFLADIAA